MQLDDSIQFRTKSLSELVTELNNLNNTEITIEQSHLIAIQESQIPEIRRFRSRSTTKLPRPSRGHERNFNKGESNSELFQNKNQQKVKINQNVQMENTLKNVGKQKQKFQEQGKQRQSYMMKQFFLVDGSQKKYYYEQIVPQLDTVLLAKIMSKFEQNFHTTIVMQWSRYRFKQLLEKVEPWMGVTAIQNTFCASFIEFKNKQAIDLLSSTQKSMSHSEVCQKPCVFYQTTLEQLFKIKFTNQNTLKILKLSKNSNNTELRLIFLPEVFFETSSLDPSLKLCKTQLLQIATYIKSNPDKKYESINKLLPKRSPLTTAFSQNFMQNSINFIINYISDNNNSVTFPQKIVTSRFQFYDRICSIANVAKRNLSQQQSYVKKLRQRGNSRRGTSQNQSQRGYDHGSSLREYNNNPREVTEIHQKVSNGQMGSDLEYCRTLERKTHKYSLSEFQNHDHDKLFPQTVPLYPGISSELEQKEIIAVLKAQHAREISQYHQTIQNLNQKILILTSDKGISDIFTIHEREIMLLELKITELRKDISKLCDTGSKNKQVQNLKQIVKKLNQQLTAYHKTHPSHKISQGKIKLLQKQLSQWKQKYQKSENARKQLKYELEALTNRIVLQDKASQHMIQDTKNKQENLSSKQEEILEQIKLLLKNSNKDNAAYICLKFKASLNQISTLRETLLYCHNFLVDLQEIIETRLMEKQPQIVLDCNRFIRGFLTENLNIF